MRIPLLLCLLLAAAAAPAQGYKAVKRWAAGCDNTRHCTAIGFAPEDAQVYAMLHFERGGAGSETVNSLPLPGSLQISNVAPMRSISRREMTSPMPVPSTPSASAPSR